MFCFIEGYGEIEYVKEVQKKECRFNISSGGCLLGMCSFLGMCLGNWDGKHGKTHDGLMIVERNRRV